MNSQIAERHPEVLGGELVFAGTRVPVKKLFDHLEAGDSANDFLNGFPGVRREQVLAVLDEARERVLAYLPDSLETGSEKRSGGRVALPIFGSRSPGALALSGDDLARLEMQEDIRWHGVPG